MASLAYNTWPGRDSDVARAMVHRVGHARRSAVVGCNHGRRGMEGYGRGPAMAGPSANILVGDEGVTSRGDC